MPFSYAGDNTAWLAWVDSALSHVDFAKPDYLTVVTRLPSLSRNRMSQAAKWGRQVGRSPGAEKRERFLSKPKNVKIAEALREGGSLRQVSEQTGAAINTVRKVKAALTEQVKS